MQQHVGAVNEVVVGRSILIVHRGPIPLGSPLRQRGWLERLVNGAPASVLRLMMRTKWCEAMVTLVAVQRTQMETSIATKVLALQGSQPETGARRLEARQRLSLLPLRVVREASNVAGRE